MSSSFLGKYLKDNYDFDTELKEENKKFWDESAAKFDSLIEVAHLPDDDSKKQEKMSLINDDGGE